MAKHITKKMLFTKAVETLTPWLHLTDWKISIKFSMSKRMKVAAYCSAHPEYKIATIWVNNDQLKSMNHNEVVSTALHELIHCVVWPLGDWAEYLAKNDTQLLHVTRLHEETVVTDLEKILLPLVEGHLNKLLVRDGYEKVDLHFSSMFVKTVT
jgi:hypothetical protein